MSSQRILVFTSRRRSTVAAVAALSLMVPLLGQSPATAAAPELPQDVSDVRVGLIKLGTALAAAAEQPALSDDLPLTDTSVRDILSLDTTIGTQVDDALATNTDTTLDTLDDAFPDGGPLVVKEASRSAGAPANSREWTMTVALEAARPVALAYADPAKRLELGTAALDGDLAATLDATIRFRYDPDALALRTFSVVGSTELTTHVWTSDDGTDGDVTQVDIPDFTVVDGFVELDASGDATIDSTTVLTLRDPNGRGQITTEDLEFSSASELFTTTTAPGAEDVAMDIDLSTPMESSATGRITVGERPDATTTYAAPKVSRSAALDGLSSLTRLQAITGFTQYTSALQTVEATVDQQFPLLDLSLTDIYSPAQQLLGLLTEQATANVVCGAADTSPPSGAPRPGEVRYCQAVTGSFEPKAGEAITWESPDAGVDITGSTTGTVGQKPTENVEVTGGDGFPTLRVTFTAEDGTVRHARSAVTSIQDLGRAIDRLGLDGGVGYDPGKQALEIAVHDETSGAEDKTVPTGGNGNLAPLTGLSGLCQAATGSSPRECRPTGDTPTGGVSTADEGAAKVTVDGRSFDADFGIGLAEAAEPVEGEPLPAGPTFYLRPGDDGLVYQVDDAKASLSEDAQMVARIGFLQVDVDVDSYSVSQTGKAASVKVPTGTVTLPSKKSVDDAVTVADLLSADPATPPTVQRGLTAAATLAVQASTQESGTRPVKAKGTVEAAWSDLLPGALPVVTTGGEYDELRLLDIVPARQGVMGAGTGDGVIKDPGADFLKQFGLTKAMSEEDRTVTRPLYDLDVPGSSSTICSRFVVIDTDQLRCDEGPLKEKGAVDEGHAYTIDGDQDALRDILIEDLAGVSKSFTTLKPELGADRTFPLVDVLPTEISAARDGLGKAVTGVQSLVDTPDPTQKISSMQDFASTFGKLIDLSVTGLDSKTSGGLAFSLSSSGPARLVLESSLATKGTRDAPLRVAAGQSELKVLDAAGKGATLPVDVTSKANVVIGVDLADASSQVRADTGVAEQITKVSGDAARLESVKGTLAKKDAEYGSARVTTGDASDIKLGIGVNAITSPKGSDGTWIDIADLPDQMEQTRAVAGAAQTCGGTATSTTAACLELPTSASTDKVMVALTADQSSGGSGGSMKVQPIAYRFLAEALGGLNLTLDDALDGDQTVDPDTGAPMSLPLVGTNLDAGADVVADVDTYVGTARTALKTVETVVGKDDGVTKLNTELTKALATVTSTLGGKNITASAGPIALDCSGSCTVKDKDGKDTDRTVDSVQKISVPVVISGKLPAKPASVPFQAGPAGSTIVSDLEVPVTTTWKLTVTVGIARGTGPFVVLDPAQTDPLLTVGVKAELPTNKAQACHSWARHSSWLEGLPGTVTRSAVPADGSDDARCIDAFVGKFPSVLVDRPASDGTAGTSLDATVVVDVTEPAGTAADHQVYLPSLYDRKADFETTVTGDGRLSVYFESFAGKAGFFDVVGLIDLGWEDGEYTDPGLQYGQLKIDVGTLNEAVFPGFKKALAWTAPLNPVVEQLAKPIPVVTNLSELVGQGPVTLLSLLQNNNSPINLIVNLLQMQNIVANKPASEVDLRPIGAGDINGFKVSPYKVGVGGKCTETGTANGKPFERKNDGKGASGRCKLGNFTKMKQFVKGEKPEKDPTGLKIDKTVTRSPYLSLPSVSVPVLQDTAQIFNLLQDTGDATMLYVDLGHAGVSGQIVRSFGPFAVGPIPVTATLGGTVGLDGRFAFGFDTRGLSKRIESLDTGHIAGFDDVIAEKPSLFSDGFYIDDLEKGVDVPEIQLTFTVQAGAAISIGIVEAGIAAGATLDLSLDAFDPNGDGKIYTDEFAGTANGPACAFNVSSGISFFLQFYFSIEFIFYTYRKSFDIARSPRLKLFEFNCETETPVLALERVVDGKDALVLTMGTEYLARKGFTSEKAEKYTVRQVGSPVDGKILLQVSAFGIVENHVVKEGTIVRADGADGSDTIRLYPIPAVTENADGEAQMAGPGDAGYVAPQFTAKAVLKGGSGSDTIETGDGDDVVDGDDGAGGEDGNDVIRTGAGDDVLRGGAGLDQLDGGQGTDTISGGGDDDRLNGGAGADELRGGDGDDVLDGGVGSSPESLFPVASAAAIRPLLDSGDLVVGGNGADSVNGGDGSDVVVGGEYDSAAAKFTGRTTVTVDAMDEDNKILSVAVGDIPTVDVPSDSAAQAQCADPGASGETGPDVVTGGPDGDVVIGGAGSDTLSGGGGADLVCGRDGDDLLDGDGTDVDVALQGDDTVRGGPGRDRMYGSAGKDQLFGDTGDDLVRGGNGADAIAGGAGSDLLLGEAGIDSVVGDNPDGTAEVADDPADAESTGRAIVCATSTSVVGGRIDLDGDLAGNDDGQLEGLSVTQGVVEDPATDSTYTGILNGVVFSDGLVDLDGNGVIEARTKTKLGDTGSVPLAGITGAVGNGDCVLGGDEVDAGLAGGAGADYVDAGGGDDTDVHGGTGNDLVRGGDGDDVVHGDSGQDLVAGDAGDDTLYGNADDDVLRGGSGKDLLAGGSSAAGAADGADEVLGDGGDDVVLGGNATLSRVALADTAIPGVGVTLLETPVPTGSDDQVFGGVGDDWVFAQEGDDRAYGGPGKDVVEGGPGSDRVQGDDDEDLLVGGSSTTGAVTDDRSAAGAPDGDDTVVGDEGVDALDGSDVMAGDNARLQVVAGGERSSWQRVRRDVAVTLFDVATPSESPSADASGDDTMRGGGVADLILGQGGDDVVAGGDGADAIEGGSGGDTVHGDGGADEILGGSWTGSTVDGGDALSGDAGDDLVLGDNGNAPNGSSAYVTLLDVPAPGATAVATLSGGDDISGGTGDDRIFGQGGDDSVRGDEGVDVLEGDAGADRLSGGAQDDVLTGGSSSVDGVISPERRADGQLDGTDVLSGGTGDDVLAGDNARLDSTDRLRADGTRLRSVLLFDVATATTRAKAGTGGADTLEGDDGRDLVFGQTGDDSLSGGADDDYLEGNAGSDSLVGGSGEDDVLGGGSSRTGAVITAFGPVVIDRLLLAPGKVTDLTAAGLLDGNDTMDGGDARDVLLGDNGRITRDGPNKTLTGGASGTHVVRQVAMADKQAGVWSGSDQLTGGRGDDDLYGQFDNTRTRRPAQAYRGVPVPGDVLAGGLGDDALIGDQGVDVPTPAGALGSTSRTLKDKKSFIRELVRPRGTLVRVVTLTQSRTGGDDLVVGNGGSDSIHAGAGKDVVNAGSGDDVVFAGDGNDALWGGAGHDRLFGGAGNDLLDVKRRARDITLWRVAAPTEDTDRLQRTRNGRDVLVGGSGADALQADQGDTGTARRAQGDRLIDWRAKVNAFKTCRSGYGPGLVLDESNASMAKTLRQLATASGAVGSGELALPINERVTKFPGRAGLVCETK